MIKDITIGQYIPGDSFVHKLDPRLKILISIIYMVDLFLMKNFIGYGLIITFLIMVVFIADLKFKYIYKGLKPIFILLIFTALINIFMTKGGVLLFSWKFIKIYSEGVRIAIFMVIRLTLLIMGTSILTLTTSPIELTDGIEALLKPFKKIGLPAHELAMMMTIALRFIPTLMDETDKIMKAQKARGADFENGSLIERGKNLMPLLVPLFISSFRRADELSVAMESRCYRGGNGRTRMKQLKLCNKDYIAIITFTIFILVTLCTRLV
ncbi:energy-coupling factor transport system permease protein [Clostridium collagenovorans DSM 3089]|uniref:Energy-coupling factor transporter transmembrane protein EcfT n=1 Tax=Clostridium collagenovorans DSM 3089 TaxID=1121306 RepID=A0A1M5WA22_9CLOT|nr:energy-coupling factor transporter transmembrane component T [Clostridium collagenovorans]SHH84310.1 energy-coupling factor transport system permease protein [Clostridium collagenovorans DSM 3089]